MAGDAAIEAHSRWSRFLTSDLGVLVLLALARLAINASTNEGYGFHRDELATLDDAGRLAWGYVAYPPITPLVGRLALELFGASTVGVRFFSAVAMSVVMVLAGLIARELGASRRGQIIAAIAVSIATIAWVAGTMLQYVAFDFLWWVTIAWLVLRRVNSGDPRWWVAIGAAIGLGMLTKYSMIFCVAGVVAGVLFTDLRRDLRSRWLWAGVALSLVVFLPNFLWQWRHDFISLEFLQHIRERDVRIGRTDDFLLDQLRLAANPLTIPLWLAGLVHLFRPSARRYRALGWMTVVPFVLFLLAQGRGYYTGPVFATLLAAGTVPWERWIAAMSRVRARFVVAATWVALAIGGAMVAALGPYSPIGSRLFQIASSVNTDMREQIGWPELVDTVASVHASLPAEERARTGILTGNYGEAGAINLYGPARGLPTAISGVNSYWLRGYPEPPPQTLIVLGIDAEELQTIFRSCEPVARITNRHGVENEETVYHPDVFLCRDLRTDWPAFWKSARRFG
ncbi:MAG: glycosyltransferase family 39 protein [Thermoanaerobaculia bacterium]